MLCDPARGVDRGEAPTVPEVPASEPGFGVRNIKTLPAVSNNDEEHIVHGLPITISQCTFQAHIARVRTVAEARAVTDAVAATAKHGAPFSTFVGPFAYRLACVGDRMQQQRSLCDVGNEGDHSRTPEDEDAGEEEGFSDDGDVGSGEKLLHLLQKWDVRHRVLMVTRVDGGFMMAELLGVRRYKFVIDRAKKLLERADLVSLRRAVDTDIYPPALTTTSTTAVTTINSNTTPAAYEEEAAAAGGSGGRLCPLFPEGQNYGAAGHKNCGHGPIKDGWGRFAMSLPAKRTGSGKHGGSSLAENPRASGCKALITSLREKNGGGGMGRAGRLPAHCYAKATGGAYPGRKESMRARGRRRALTIAHLSISSQTVPFPRGHVPSVMGDKGHGKKRGRINHFAVRTPPLSSPSRDSLDDNGRRREDGDRAASFRDPRPTADASITALARHAMTSGWSLPHELDPTSAFTRPGDQRGTDDLGRTIQKNRSAYDTAVTSRLSTCDTINSPRRVAAILLGVVGAHSALPPPFIEMPADGELSMPSSEVDTNDSFKGNNGISSFQGAAGTAGAGGQVRLPLPAASGGGGGGRGGGGIAAGGGGVRDDGNTGGDTPALPLLGRTPGSHVRDESPPTLVVIPERTAGSGGGNDVYAAAIRVPSLSKESAAVGRWHSDDGDSSVGATESSDGGDEIRQRGAGTAPAKGPLQNPTKFKTAAATSSVDPSFVNHDLDVGDAAPLAPRRDMTEEAVISRGGARRRREDTPDDGAWMFGSLADSRGPADSGDRGGLAAGRLDEPPPTRSKSAVRGWTADRAVPASSPLLTKKRADGASKAGR